MNILKIEENYWNKLQILWSLHHFEEKNDANLWRFSSEFRVLRPLILREKEETIFSFLVLKRVFLGF